MCQAAIITCHDGYSHGASLQAYALSKFIADAGHTVSIINYKPGYLDGQYKLDTLCDPRFDYPGLRQLYFLAKLPGRLLSNGRKEYFDKFKSTYLPLTTECYHSLDELRAADIRADILIAGSDQIWNTFLNNGHDPAFYLDFGPEKARRISYGASFGSALLAHGSELSVKKHLGLLDEISVRERTGVDLLRSLGYDGEHVCDPVFLLPADEWRELASGAELPALPERYILTYDLEGSSLITSQARARARELRCPIISLGYPTPHSRHLVKAGPVEFLALFDGAKEIFSNSYHALAFSKIFGKSHNLIMRSDQSNARMLDLTGTNAEQLEARIERSKNFLLSSLAMKMKIVS